MSFFVAPPGSEQTVYDMAIVGAGPAGTTAAIYGARAKLKVVLIDKAKLGGALGITGRIANYPGIGFDREVSGAELLRLMHDHAEAFGVEFLVSQVYGLSLEGDTKEIYTADRMVSAKTVVLATGAGSRDNKLPGEQELLGRGVSYCATCDAAFYSGKTVALLGLSEEAVEEALVLARFADAVHLICPGPKLLAEPTTLDELEANQKITVHLRSRPLAIEGDDRVTGLRVSREREPTTLAVDGVFVYLPGGKPATDFLEGLLQLDERGYVVVDAELRTSVPGVFAAGDVRGGPVQQVITAAADGCLVALSADRYLNRRNRVLSQR